MSNRHAWPRVASRGQGCPTGKSDRPRRLAWGLATAKAGVATGWPWPEGVRGHGVQPAKSKGRIVLVIVLLIVIPRREWPGRSRARPPPLPPRRPPQRLDCRVGHGQVGAWPRAGHGQRRHGRGWTRAMATGVGHVQPGMLGHGRRAGKMDRQRRLDNGRSGCGNARRYGRQQPPRNARDQVASSPWKGRRKCRRAEAGRSRSEVGYQTSEVRDQRSEIGSQMSVSYLHTFALSCSQTFPPSDLHTLTHESHPKSPFVSPPPGLIAGHLAPSKSPVNSPTALPHQRSFGRL
jgi:hypothetical protein